MFLADNLIYNEVCHLATINGIIIIDGLSSLSRYKYGTRKWSLRVLALRQSCGYLNKSEVNDMVTASKFRWCPPVDMPYRYLLYMNNIQSSYVDIWT